MIAVVGSSPMLHLPDVAAMLRVSERTVRRWCAQGKIPHYRIGRRLMFDQSEIRAWIQARRKAGFR